MLLIQLALKADLTGDSDGISRISFNTWFSAKMVSSAGKAAAISAIPPVGVVVVVVVMFR